MKYLAGSCLCGKVKIRVADEFDFLGYCHCSECRKWSGSAFAAGGRVNSGDFEIISGEEFVSFYPKSEATSLGFCSSCGASLFSKKHKQDKYVVRLGILDDVPTRKPNVHIFAASKAPWFEITDELDKFDEVP